MFLINILFLIFSTVNLDLQHPKNTADFTVYIFLSEDCPICRYYVHDINRLYDEFESENISIIGVFPNFSSKPQKIKTFVADYKLSIPTKTDYFKKISTAVGATKTPEVIIQYELNKIIYRGRIDNAFAALGKRRRVVTEHNLKNILIKLEKGLQIPFTQIETIGCYINYSDLK